jgi:hypothetical protein
MNWRTIFWTAILGVVGLVGLSVASMGTKIRPKVTIQTVETNKETGIVVLQLTAEVWTDVHEIEIRAFGDSGIVPSGYQSFSMMTDGRDTVCFPISLVVPMADTTQVLFFIVEKTGKEGWNSRTFVVPGQHGGVDTLRQAPHFGDETFVVGQLYFIRTSDTLIVTDTDPGYSETINMHVETPDARSIPFESGGLVQVETPQQNGTSRTGFTLKDGTFVPADNLTEEERRTFASTHKLFRRDADEKPNRIGQPFEAALASAASALGFDYMKLMMSGALKARGVETLVDTTTPFVHGELSTRRVWRLDVGGITFDDSLPSLDESTTALRDFTVFVDSASGVVLRVMTRGPHFDESVIRRASASFAEEQLSQMGERYVEVPTITPVVSLKEALKWSSIQPELAMEVVADYLVVEYSVGHHKGPRPAWVVNMNGGFSFPVGCFPGAPLIACNHYRLVVDAQTGDVLCSTNWPNPPPSK